MIAFGSEFASAFFVNKTVKSNWHKLLCLFFMETAFEDGASHLWTAMKGDFKDGPFLRILLLAFSRCQCQAQWLETSSLVPTNLKGPFLLHLGEGDIQHLQLKKTHLLGWMSRCDTPCCRVGGTSKFRAQCYPEPQRYPKPQRTLPKPGHVKGMMGPWEC